MKKTILALGLVVTLIGISILPYYNQAQTVTGPKAISHNTNQWSLSSNLEKGDNVTVEYREHYNWSQGSFDIGDEGQATLYLYMDITDPNGNMTRFMVELWLADVGWQQMRRLLIYNISLLQSGSIDTHLMLDADGHLGCVGGTIPVTGEYTVSVKLVPSRVDQPPSYLGFFHNVTSTRYPNFHFLPVGAAFAVAGGTISIFGLKSGTYQKSAKQRNLYKSKKE